MAAAVSSSGIIDLKAHATFPIRLGNTISKPAKSTTRYASVRYNYRPEVKSASDVTASIEAGDNDEETKLVLDAEDGEYKYAGKYEQEESQFVLVLRGEGKDREMILERLDGCHGFNLVATPKESDAMKLYLEHPYLSADGPGEDDLFGDDDMPPDESNPFDFRHFLKAELDKAQNTQQSSVESSKSTLGTPLVQHATASAPARKPAKAAPTKAAAPSKRKTPAKEKVNPKRVKAGEEPAPVAEMAKPKARPEAPEIRVDRKASVVRRPSIEDSGELILENETPVSEKPPQHRGAMALALSGQLGGGPISLRSAASSPGVASPMPEKEEETEQNYEFEFGNSSSPEPDEGGDADVDMGLELEDDDDVDDLELPSPAQKRASLPNAAAGEDEEDDMEKALELALAGDDSEESEEE